MNCSADILTRSRSRRLTLAPFKAAVDGVRRAKGLPAGF
jgi:hypothetical protein